MHKILFSALLAFALAQTGSQPTAVPIQNPSFEQGAIGWQFGAGSTVTTAPDGKPAAGAGYGSSFYQVLTTTPAQLQALPPPSYYKEGVYALTFSVMNYFPTYPGAYEVEIDFGTQKLCESYGWGTIVAEQVTIICPGPGYLVIDQALPSGDRVQGSENFVLHFTVNDGGGGNGGWPLLFKGPVSLTFTPN